MADTVRVLPADALDIRVSGRLMTDFPDAGTYMTIEKISPRSAFVQGRIGSATHVRNNAKGYRVTLNLLQGHPDDQFMAAALIALQQSTNVLTFSFNVGGTLYVSGAMDVETEPTRELASDASPVLPYTMVGVFPQVLVGQYFQPTQLSEDQITAFQP